MSSFSPIGKNCREQQTDDVHQSLDDELTELADHGPL
jgi:hypothetical protein